jgi:Family of unknown function (DUF6491)
MRKTSGFRDMNIRTIVRAIAASMLTMTVAGTAMASDASIPFADHGGIRDWSPDGNQALYVQARDSRWYRAELMGYCPDLPHVLSIAFISEASGEFDRFSSIVVRGQRCMLKSLTESDPPPNKAKAAIETTPDEMTPKETSDGEAADGTQMP